MVSSIHCAVVPHVYHKALDCRERYNVSKYAIRYLIDIWYSTIFQEVQANWWLLFHHTQQEIGYVIYFWYLVILLELQARWSTWYCSIVWCKQLETRSNLDTQQSCKRWGYTLIYSMCDRSGILKQSKTQEVQANRDAIDTQSLATEGTIDQFHTEQFARDTSTGACLFDTQSFHHTQEIRERITKSVNMKLICLSTTLHLLCCLIEGKRLSAGQIHL